jgi:hypothetical protein
MSGSATPISITLTANDKTGAAINAVGKRLQSLTAPATNVSNSLAKLGDPQRLVTLAQGMQSLGGRTLGVFRSLDRVSPLLAGITGAASLYGMTQMVQRWGELGQKVSNASQRLGIPTDRLTALQGAARLAGSSAEDLTAGLGALDEKLAGARFGRDSMAIQVFQKLGVGLRNADGSARDASSAFMDVAQSIKGVYDAGGDGRHQAVRFAQTLGIENLLPLLLKGKAGIQDLQAEAARHGVVLSPEMAKNATALNKSFTDVEQSAEGLGNKIADVLAKPVAALNEKMSKWLDTNRDLIGVDVAGWVDKIGTALNNIDQAKADALIGGAIGYKIGGIRGALVGAGAGYLYGSSTGAAGIPIEPGALPSDGTVGGWWGNHAPTWLGGNSPADEAVPAQRISVPGIPSRGFAELQRSHDFWASKGLKEYQIAGILSTETAESGGNASRWNDDHTSFGLYQYTGSRLRAIQARYGTQEPTADQQREFAWDELQGPEREARRLLYTAHDAREAGQAFTHFERPRGENQRARERGDAAPQFEGRFGPATPSAHPLAWAPQAAPPATVSGGVDVAIKLDVSGHQPIATATATSTGHARALPPNVAMPMSGIAGDYSRGY